MNIYDEDYYERGVENGKSLYSNFRWIPELTIPMCHHIAKHLNIEEETDTILDFGCAKGYVVKGFRLLGIKSFGVDISEYAISNCADGVENFLYLINENCEIPIYNNEKYTWCIAKDVFEHIDYQLIDKTLENIKKSCKNIFVIVPLGDGKKYYIDSYELDKTHIIREDIDWWIRKIEKSGFSVFWYDKKLKHIKENWSKYKNGNGFILARS